ncbi:MAG: ammonium transporter [Myxococcales bacterium]|nr:ammonium transporter [Myxococcales bacterium]
MPSHTAPELARVVVDLQVLWTLLCAALVLLMQAGFCCLEAGAVRHKNSVNVAAKNVVDLCISFPAFFVVGYALMFGEDRFGLFGHPSFFLSELDAADLTAFVYQAAFCSTAATIVSGGVAERCRFLPYMLMSAVTAAVIYPLFGHSVWGGGVLSQLGFHDFAGASVVHMVGAGITLAGVQVMGARRDRFDAEGGAQPIPASSMPMVAVGVIILTFGWIGFNGGSAPLGDQTAEIITNTLLAACFGGLGALLITWAYRGLASVEPIFNGVLAGLVSITACADVVSLQAASLVGIAGGMAMVLATAALERLRLDDAVGAIPVHGAGGLVGILLTAGFAKSEYLAEAGIDRLELLRAQGVGALACLLWSYSVGYLAWALVARVTTLRVGPVEESVGMNFSEHQVDNEAHALTRSLLETGNGRLPTQATIDAIGGDQFAALANSIHELARERDNNDQQAVRWSNDLDAISGTLDLNQRIGRETIESYHDEVLNVDRTLEHISTLLEGDGVDSQALTIASDSITNLRRRVDLLRHKLPSGIDSWEQINRMTERLDLLAGTIRGDVRETS